MQKPFANQARKINHCEILSHEMHFGKDIRAMRFHGMNSLARGVPPNRASHSTCISSGLPCPELCCNQNAYLENGASEGRLAERHSDGYFQCPYPIADFAPMEPHTLQMGKVRITTRRNAPSQGIHSVGQAMLCFLLIVPCCLPASAQKPSKSVLASKPAAKKIAGTTKAVKPVVPKPVGFAATVMVRVSPEVGGQSFTLGEIADISGSDKALVKQLSDLLIGTSPLPGMTRLLRPGDITLRLRGARLESPLVDVVAPPEMKISRSKSDVAADEIVKAAQPVAQDAIKDLTDTSIEATLPVIPTTLPKGKVAFLAGAVRGEPSLGKLTVPISVQVDGKPQQTVDVTFTVRRRTKVLIATRTLEPNAVLTMEDLAFAKIDLPSGFVRPALALQETIGKRVKAKVLADAPLSLNNLDTPPAVKYNDRVTIEFVISSVRITAPGLVRGSGAIGDTVRVYAPDTKKDIDALIVDAHTVRVPDLDAPTTPEPTEETEEP